MEIFVTDQKDVRHVLGAEATGASLMSVIRDAGSDIQSAAGTRSTTAKKEGRRLPEGRRRPPNALR
jgi:hypothetical protein